MMRIDVIDAAAVDVEGLAQVFGAHGAALDVPAGEAHAPGAVPLHLALLVFRGELPERKIRGVALLGVDFDPRPGLLLLEALPGKLPVAGKLRDVKVDPIRRSVCVALLLELLDQRDLVSNVLGRPGDDMGPQDVEALRIFEERLGIELRDLPGALAGAACPKLYLIFALVSVACEVPHVSDVHDVLDFVAVVFEHPSEDVLKDICSEIPDVGVVVDRRPAGVEPNFHISDGHELFLAPTKRVEELQGRHSIENLLQERALRN
jgi:hypothetical protein